MLTVFQGRRINSVTFYSSAEKWICHGAACNMRQCFIPTMGFLGFCVTEVTTTSRRPRDSQGARNMTA